MQSFRAAMIALAVLVLGACSQNDRSAENPAAVAAPPPVADTRHVDQVPPPTTKSVLLLNGSVDATNAARFTKFVADNLDAVIGVKIDVNPSTDEDFDRRRYLVSADDRLLAIFKGEAEGEGIEVVVPNGSYGWLHGHHTIDGFFVVKSGGIHQGTLSYGLEPTDEGAIRTNPGVRIVERDLE